MYGDFRGIPLAQQSFGMLIGSASCGIGGGGSLRQSPSIRRLVGGEGGGVVLFYSFEGAVFSNQVGGCGDGR